MITEELAQHEDISLVAGVECAGHEAIGINNIIPDSDNLPDADVWMDSSIANAAMVHIHKASRLGKPIVVAATGFSDKDNNEIRNLAESCPVLITPNLSTGIGVMDNLVNKASKLLGKEFESALFEMHHSAKRDAPSGTALQLVKSAGIDNKPEKVAALRAGGLVGEHQVHFVGEFEELVISHRAWSRQAFAKGVPRAIRFIYNKEAGLYSIKNLYNTD